MVVFWVIGLIVLFGCMVIGGEDWLFDVGLVIVFDIWFKFMVCIDVCCEIFEDCVVFVGVEILDW